MPSPTPDPDPEYGPKEIKAEIIETKIKGNVQELMKHKASYCPT